jgi:hypothetical protein
MVMRKKKLLVSTLVSILAMVEMFCWSKDGEKKTMKDSNPMEFQSVRYLKGFWQISHPLGNYLAILERDSDQLHSILSIWQIAAGNCKLLKKISNEDVSIKNFDAYSPDSNLYICTEVNSTEAVNVVSCNPAELVNPERRVPFKEVGHLKLSPAQSEKVNLPVSREWSVATILPPGNWLFNPRFVRGQIGTPWIIANTADGQAMIFSLDPNSQELEEFVIQNALEPQACIYRGKRCVAFKGVESTVYPFWSSLKVAIDKEATVDLSAGLKIGPIIGFSMVTSGEGDLWIFVLRDAVVGTDVVALRKGSQGWAVVGEKSLKGDVEKLSAEKGEGVFHLVFASRKGEAWSLRYLPWPMAR